MPSIRTRFFRSLKLSEHDGPQGADDYLSGGLAFLHWADPSSLELIRFLLSDSKYPALVICVYRPTLTLLSNQQIANLGKSYVDIRPEDLSPAETGTMVGSLPKTEHIPADFEHFLRNL